MSIRPHVEALIALVEQGKILEAYDQFYGEGVVMSENLHPSTVGKAENRLREEAFVAKVAAVHENRAVFSVVEGDRAIINWILDFTNTEGQRLYFDQIAVQTWKDDRIVAERFVYDPTSMLK